MSDDDELQRAVALSLQEAERQAARAEEGDSDEEERFQRQLQEAINASKSESSNKPVEGTSGESAIYLSDDDSGSGGNSSKRRSMSPTEVLEKEPLMPQTARMTAFLSERAKLEQERLERQKRKRGDTEERANDGEEGPEKKRREMSTGMTERSREKAPIRGDGGLTVPASGASSRSRTSSEQPEQQMYWDGELRQIANKHVDPSKDTRPTFRLSAIIGKKSDLAFAIISSYAVAVAWVYSFFDPDTPVIQVAQPDEEGNASIKNVLPKWVKTTPFLRNGMGCMHIKFMLLFYKSGRLRILLPTANFVDYDWRDIENTAWVQDIPRLSKPSSRKGKPPNFPSTLERTLRALNVPAALVTHLKEHPNIPIRSIGDLSKDWDWSKVKVQLVASLAGKHQGWDEVTRTGHPALVTAINNLGVAPSKSQRVTLEYQGSSIGTYSTNWLNEFYASARGASCRPLLEQTRAQRSKAPFPNIKVIFPSLQTVKSSVLGVPGGGTIFCRKAQWEGLKFPRELFHDSKSKRGRVLMHSKMILATYSDGPLKPTSGASKKQTIIVSDSEDDEDDEVTEVSKPGGSNNVGWVYVGSHNFTPSAWGTLSGTPASPVLNLINYEMGIVIPIRNSEEASELACWERPPRKYTSSDRPWIQEEVLAPLLAAQAAAER